MFFFTLVSSELSIRKNGVKVKRDWKMMGMSSMHYTHINGSVLWALHSAFDCGRFTSLQHSITFMTHDHIKWHIIIIEYWIILMALCSMHWFGNSFGLSEYSSLFARQKMFLLNFIISNLIHEHRTHPIKIFLTKFLPRTNVQLNILFFFEKKT